MGKSITIDATGRLLELRIPQLCRDDFPPCRLPSAGYRLRTDRWAYTAWMSFDWGVGSDPKGEASVPVFSDISALELYDHEVCSNICGSNLFAAGSIGCLPAGVHD